MQTAPRLARAQAANTIRIGVLNDQSGLYRDVNGPGSVVCVRQAIADSGVAARGFNVEVVVGDHQNRPDVGSNITRQWLDRDGVDLVLDVPTSSVALAVNSIVREKNKVHMNSSGATSDLTGAQCSAEHRALDLRHLHAGEVDRRRHGEGRRRHLVLPDRRLRLRPRAGARHLELRARRRRPGGGQRPHALPGHHGLLVLPRCRRRPAAPRWSAWPMPAATPSTASSRRPSSA